jgi:hypothetical protein
MELLEQKVPAVRGRVAAVADFETVLYDTISLYVTGDGGAGQAAQSRSALAAGHE